MMSSLLFSQHRGWYVVISLLPHPSSSSPSSSSGLWSRSPEFRLPGCAAVHCTCSWQNVAVLKCIDYQFVNDHILSVLLSCSELLLWTAAGLHAVSLSEHIRLYTVLLKRSVFATVSLRPPGLLWLVSSHTPEPVLLTVSPVGSVDVFLAVWGRTCVNISTR